MSNWSYNTGKVPTADGNGFISKSGYGSSMTTTSPGFSGFPSGFGNFKAMTPSSFGSFPTSFAQSSSCSSSVSTQTINGITKTVKKFQVNGIDVTEAEYNKACAQTGGKKKIAAKKPAAKKPAAKKPAAKKAPAKKK
jgi:hypothetical protein